ncbi:MAG: MnhB domain-containing protein [Elusimicrobiota bacterium]
MKGMTLIVKTVTRLTLGLIMLFGFYIFMHGHVSHGVGFAGGVIIALGFIHLMLAYGKKYAAAKIGEKQAYLLKNSGLLILLAISAAGFMYGKGFLGNFLGNGKPFELFSAGIMLLFNTAICAVVAGCLYLVFITLVEFKIKK